MPFLVFQRIAEQRIQDAMRKGEFDDLPGKGKPLQLEDLSHVPEELRLAYKVLKNAGFLPPEAELLREIKTVEDLIEHMEEEEHRYRQIRRLNYLIMKLNQLRGRRIDLEKEQVYYDKIVARVEVHGSKKAKAKKLEALEEGRLPKVDLQKLQQQVVINAIARLASRRA